MLYKAGRRCKAWGLGSKSSVNGFQYLTQLLQTTTCISKIAKAMAMFSSQGTHSHEGFPPQSSEKNTQCQRSITPIATPNRPGHLSGGQVLVLARGGQRITNIILKSI